MTTTTRAEHIDWCKQRALAYVETNQLEEAVTSMASDLQKHPETKDHPARGIMLLALMTGNLSTKENARHFIQGFN